MGSIRGVLALPAKESDGKDVRVTQIRHNERILDDLPSACGMDYNVTLRLGLPTSPHPCFPFFFLSESPTTCFWTMGRSPTPSSGCWVDILCSDGSPICFECFSISTSTSYRIETIVNLFFFWLLASFSAL